MLRADLFRSCSYAPIADAALRSIGYDFRNRVSHAAETCGQQPGDYTVKLLDRFAGIAGPDEWRQLDYAMAGRDMPVLSGLQFVVETMLERRPNSPQCG